MAVMLSVLVDGCIMAARSLDGKRLSAGRAEDSFLQLWQSPFACAVHQWK